MTHSKHRQNPLLLFPLLFFWKEDFNFFYLYVFFVLQQSLMHKLLLRKHVSSSSPAGVAQQSRHKQVPVLRLFSVCIIWYWTELHTPLPFCAVHGKYIRAFTQHIKLNTLQWHEHKGEKKNKGSFVMPFLYLSDPKFVQRHYLWFEIDVKSHMKRMFQKIEIKGYLSQICLYVVWTFSSSIFLYCMKVSQNWVITPAKCYSKKEVMLSNTFSTPTKTNLCCLNDSSAKEKKKKTVEKGKMRVTELE